MVTSNLQEALEKKGYFNDIYKERAIDFSFVGKKEEKIIDVEPPQKAGVLSPRVTTVSIKRSLQDFKEVKKVEYIELLELKIKGLESKLKSQEQFQKEWLEKADLIRENQRLKEEIMNIKNKTVEG